MVWGKRQPLNEYQNDLLLDLPAAGTLELFHQRIDPTRGFQSIGAWTLVQTFKAEAGPLRLRLPPAAEPVAVPDTARSEAPQPQPPIQIDAWIAVAFIDTDRDGASDAAEVLQNVTNPLDPKNNMPRDGDPLADWRALVMRGHFDAMMRHPETQVVFVDPKAGDDRLDGSRADLGDAKSGCGPKRTIAAAVAGRSGTLVVDLAPGVHPLPDSGLPRYEGTLTYNTSRGPVHFATPDILSRRGQQLLSPGSTKP